MFHGSYPNTPGLVTAPVGLPSLLPSLLPAFLSLCLPWWPTHPHCNSSSNNRSSSPYLSLESLPPKPERPPSLLFNFTLFPDLCLRFGLNPFDEGLCSHCSSTGSAAGPGQASCCSSNSVVLNGDVGRIKLVIFQAWSVLGRYAIGEC